MDKIIGDQYVLGVEIRLFQPVGVWDWPRGARGPPAAVIIVANFNAWPKRPQSLGIHLAVAKFPSARLDP